MPNIYSLIIHITNSKGETHSPLYEVHTWERAEEIINNTRQLIAESSDSTQTFTFEVLGRGL
jgi:hypothetical protein